MRDETIRQSLDQTQQLQAPKRGKLANGKAREAAMAMRGLRSAGRETRVARLDARSHRARNEARLVDVPPSGDGIGDRQIRYSPLAGLRRCQGYLFKAERAVVEELELRSRSTVARRER